MAKFLGSTTREIDGETWRLVLDFNAICHFEEAVGGNFFERAEDWQTGSGVPRARELRALIHAALQAHHPQATLQEAGRILSQGMEIFEALMASAMTEAEAGPEKKPQAAVP